MTRKHHAPVASFGDDLMAAMLNAAIKPTTLTLPWKRAVQLRQRAYMLRAAMKAEGHPSYTVVTRVRITLDVGDAATQRRGTSVVPSDPNAPTIVTFAPNDSEFGLPQHTHQPSNATEGRGVSDAPMSSSDLEDLLKDL